MTKRCLTEDEFLADVTKHQMTVIKDDGVYRHIRFKNPATRDMYFDLVTWPGYLAYTGDMGDYLFCRLEDMFEFFRTDRDYAHRRGRKLVVNPGYWRQKLVASCRDGVVEFDEEAFDRRVIGHMVEWMKEHRHETTKEDRRELWEDVGCYVIDASPEAKKDAAYDYSNRVGENQLTFDFSDCWEWNCDRFTHRFEWACYAIAWGIQQYDEENTIA